MRRISLIFTVLFLQTGIVRAEPSAREELRTLLEKAESISQSAMSDDEKIVRLEYIAKRTSFLKEKARSAPEGNGYVSLASFSDSVNPNESPNSAMPIKQGAVVSAAMNRSQPKAEAGSSRFFSTLVFLVIFAIVGFMYQIHQETGKGALPIGTSIGASIGGDGSKVPIQPRLKTAPKIGTIPRDGTVPSHLI